MLCMLPQSMGQSFANWSFAKVCKFCHKRSSSFYNSYKWLGLMVRVHVPFIILETGALIVEMVGCHVIGVGPLWQKEENLKWPTKGGTTWSAATFIASINPHTQIVFNPKYLIMQRAKNGQNFCTFLLFGFGGTSQSYARKLHVNGLQVCQWLPSFPPCWKKL
jgi:hypothetical protein